MVYTSTANPKIKRIASYKEKKYRIKDGKYLIEGIKMVNDAIAYGQKLECIVIVESLLNQLIDTDVEILLVDEKVIKYVSDAVNPQGVLAVAEIPHFDTECIANENVLLDGIQDPGNLGTIIRTMSACGVKDLYLINCVDTYSPKTVRSTMSGLFFVNIHEISYSDLQTVFRDTPIIIADMYGENLYNYKPPEKYCICIGNESNGVSEYVRKCSSGSVAIPMQEHTVESLNAGVALSIILYQFKYSK